MKKILFLTSILVASNIYSNPHTYIFEGLVENYEYCSVSAGTKVRDALDAMETCANLNISNGMVPHGSLMTHEGWLIQGWIQKDLP